MTRKQILASMRDYPGGWVLMILIATALALIAAGSGWIVCLVLVAMILAVPLAKAADTAKRYLKIPRGVVVFGIPVLLVLLVVVSLTMGGIDIKNAIERNLKASRSSVPKDAGPVGSATREAGPGEDQGDTTAAGALTRFLYRDWMARIGIKRQRMRETVSEWLLSAHTIVGQVLGPVMSGLSGVVTALGVLLVSALMALNPKEYYHVFVTLFPPTLRPRVEPVLKEIGGRIARWALARIVSATALTAMTIVGLAIIGVDEAVSLGLITGLLSFIPVIGTVLAGGIALLTVIVTQSGSLIGVLIVFVIANVVETYVLLPVLLRRAANIPPGLTIGSLLVMGTVGGLPGMLIASPLVLILTTVAETSRDAREADAEPDEPAPPSADPPKRKRKRKN